MSFLGGIGDAIGGALGGIGDAIGGVVGGALDGLGGLGDMLGGLTDVLGGVMNSPLGGLISAVFPPAGAIMGGLNMLGMVSDIAGQIGGGENY